MNPFKDAELTRGNNMVRTMKSKFEPNDNTENWINQPKHTKTLPNLSRQLSDPVKVKRTPAFRSDQKPFQRGHGNATSYREKKTVLKVNDKPTNVHLLRKQFDSKDDQPRKRVIAKALTERSNSSAEIILNRCSNRNYENISALYTEPIPKNLRPANAIHNMSTLKISDKSNKTEVLQNVQNSMCDDISYKLDALTDTLKFALNKPLPTGPAPQKPPRTFMHHTSNSSSPVASVTNSPIINNNKRKEFAAKLNVNLHKNLKQNPVNNNHTMVTNHSSTSSSSISNKPDPRYMLEKLENALKTNRIKRRSSSTEGRRMENKIENSTASSRSKINLNCLHSLNCTNNAYEHLPNVKMVERRVGKKDEPVYAEPFAVLTAEAYDCPEDAAVTLRCRFGDNGKSNRNSLYYMSTPISTESVPRQSNGHNNILEFPRNMETVHSTDVRYLK